MTKKDRILTIKITEEMQEKLRVKAEKDRRSVSSYVRMIIDKVISGELKP